MKKVCHFLINAKGFRFFTNSSSLGVLIGKCALLLAIPYAYLFLCGAVFDALLKWYFMTTFIFFSMIFLYVIAIILVIFAILRYRYSPRKAG